MAGSVEITIHPSGAEPELLAVGDVLRQVLDFVELLEHLEDPVLENRRIVWRLAQASTNSRPLTVVASPFPRTPDSPIFLEAEQVADRASVALTSLVQGIKPEWLEAKPSAMLHRIFERHQQGLGQTDIKLGNESLISLLPRLARIASLALEQESVQEETERQGQDQTEFGSIEGKVSGLTSWRSRPVLQVIERLSDQDVSCILSDELAQKMGLGHTWSEVWDGRYLSLRGKLVYNPNRSIKCAYVESAKDLEWTTVELSDLEDIDILQGRSVTEHLRRLWGE